MKTIITLTFFVLSNVSFSQIQIGNDINGESAGDLSGSKISLSSDGNIVAIGAIHNDSDSGDFWDNSGHVRVFKNESGIWTQIGQDIDGATTQSYLGRSLSLSSDGTVLAIGAPISSTGNLYNHGKVQVYNYDNTSDTWVQNSSTINSDIIYDYFGNEICLSSDGSVIAISGRGDNGNDNDMGDNDLGYVSIYKNESGIWTQIGSNIIGENFKDYYYGLDISLSSDGTTIAIGSPINDGNDTDSGSTRIFKNESGTWTQVGQDIDGEALGDESGSTVSLSSDGSIIAIGAPGSDTNGYNSGHVKIYKNESGTWTQIGQNIDGELAYNNIRSVSLSSIGSIIAIGAIGNDDNARNAGHVRIYKNESGSWIQVGEDIDGDFNDYLGYSVSLSSEGSIVAISAINHDRNGDDSGQVRMFDFSSALSLNDVSILKTKIYPNPVKEVFTIQLQNGNKLEKAELYNSFGQFIKSYKTSIIPIKDVAKGIYFLKINTILGESIEKIIVE